MASHSGRACSTSNGQEKSRLRCWVASTSISVWRRYDTGSAVSRMAKQCLEDTVGGLEWRLMSMNLWKLRPHDNRAGSYGLADLPAGERIGGSSQSTLGKYHRDPPCGSWLKLTCSTHQSMPE
ncbi:hypothetical protein BASA61_010564 [Batrachochytrium salamandrivorans]|nr:hypothetical protein BASA61_010564 [Batrachochytrium salamandrivorans]